ncbi:hypothetical protein PM082_003729 [Marasmius tenuissimus]|nr:hypothetical protein PM082_003729 [Marasmius tenuissimus]
MRRGRESWNGANIEMRAAVQSRSRASVIRVGRLYGGSRLGFYRHKPYSQENRGQTTAKRYHIPKSRYDFTGIA